VERISEPAVVTAVALTGKRDRLLTFLTPNQGGVRLFAKRLPLTGPVRRFIEPLQGGELVFDRPHEGGQGRLQSFVPQRVWPGIRSSCESTWQALAFLELVTLSVTEGTPQPELFALLVEFLNRLESEKRPGLARILATLRLLVAGGFAPRLESCVGCSTPVSPGTGVLFSPEGGGVVCRTCLPLRGEETLPVSAAAHGFLMRALTLPEGQARRLRVSFPIEREISRMLDIHFEARTGVRPRCGGFLESLEAG
jgi:DNA repair protein RecO (recombination protein O)